MSRRLALSLCLIAYLGLAASNQSGSRSPHPDYLHPDFQIAGMAKSGTSQMYQLLSTHRDTKAVRKEWCPPNAQDMQGYAQQLSAAMRDLMAQDKFSGTQVHLTGAVPKLVTPKRGPVAKIVSACINPVLSLEYYKWVKENGAPLQSTPKFIYLMRDPADLLWARFNFWTTDADKNTHVPGKWTQTDNFRSPEYFQVMLEAEGLIYGSYNVSDEYLRRLYNFNTIDGLMRRVGQENVMVVNSADLEEPRVDAFIKRFSNWTGLSLQGFDKRILMGHTNSGSSLKTRGAANVISTDDRKAGVYEISGFRPMLPKSREFIYKRAKRFCEEAKAKYGVYFRCLAHHDARAMTKQQEQANMLRGQRVHETTIAEWSRAHDHL